MTTETKAISREEFINDAMRELHDALLTGGATKMRVILKGCVLPAYTGWLRENGWIITPPARESVS